MMKRTVSQQIKWAMEELLEMVGESLEQWLNPQKLRPEFVPIPVPVDRRPRRR
jgi:hypothetical protein